MTELAISGDKRMTVREVAEALGVSIDTVYNSAKELFPELFRHGKTSYLNEVQVTAVKKNFRKNSEVEAQPKTSLEKALVIQQALVYQQEIIADLQRRTAKQAECLAIAEPKAETLDKMTASESDVSVRELAAILAVPHLGQNNLFQKLRDDGYIDGFNRPYRKYIEQGIMYEKEYYVPQMDATKRQLRITQKGVAHFAGKYATAKTA